MCPVYPDDLVSVLVEMTDVILELRQLNYSWNKIATMMGISRWTLYRRLDEFGIDATTFTDISEPHLDEVLRDIKRQHPNYGEVMLQGCLLHMNIKVPRAMLRQAIHRVDHINTVYRQSDVIRRRVYTSPHPNAVWHIDGNHKIIRWRLVVHAGVDGFSRLLVYIKCANNNAATTVFDAFSEGISEFGMPTHVRSDHGGENYEVWRYMLSTYDDPSHVITGRSTHNERVERMWRDVTRCVSSSFIDVFYALESDGALDPANEVDIFCLHLVFLPRINKALADFRGSWNRHPLSTEGNMSPLQLFTEGLCETAAADQANVNQSPTPYLTADSEARSTFGETEVTSVEVPSNLFAPCSQLLAELQSSINPLSECSDIGQARVLCDSCTTCWSSLG